MKPHDLASVRDLFIAIHEAAKPRKVERKVERKVYDGDGTLVRTEHELETWTEPGDVGAMQWAIMHRIPPE